MGWCPVEQPFLVGFGSVEKGLGYEPFSSFDILESDGLSRLYSIVYAGEGVVSFNDYHGCHGHGYG